MIKAIIFDSYDTVIRDGLNFVLKKGQTLKPETWQPFWRGEITEEQFWQKTAADFNEDSVWIERSMATYYSKSVPIKKVLSLVEKLKRKYKLGFLANAPKPWIDDAVSRFNLDKIFDVLVFSGKTGLLKPEKEIYLLTCQKLGVLPQECLYVDDNQVKVKAAQDLGMQGIWFKNTEQLENELKKERLL